MYTLNPVIHLSFQLYIILSVKRESNFWAILSKFNQIHLDVSNTEIIPK